MTQAVEVPQWQPTEQDIADARVTDFARFVQRRTGANYPDYQSLWRWSVDDPAAFWGALWEYFGLGEPPKSVLDNPEMPGTRWFPGVQLNYVDQIVRNARSDRPAILYVGEDGSIAELSWSELLRRTAAFAQLLRSHGVTAGDRIVGYLPNIPEAVIAFLATASIGAIWSACGQDYSAKAALDRLGQLEPVVLVTADGYPVQPGITIPKDATDVVISATGNVEIKVPGNPQLQQVGQLQLATFVNQAGLEALGGNLFAETPASGPATIAAPGDPGFGTLRQGFLEASNVNPVAEITALITAQRAYEMNSRVVKTADEMLATTSQMR